MRAYHIPSLTEEPRLMDINEPTPKAGEIRLKIMSCGLNFADLLMIERKYQDTPEPPYTLGMEVAGIVDAIGPDTDAPPIGTRVAVFGGQGGLAQYGCFDANRAVALPPEMSMNDAAAFQIAYGTSHVALHHRAQMKPGETLLVLGAAGGVGLTAVEVGKLMGARVIACARGADKLLAAQNAGADHLVDAETPDLRAAFKSLGGADVIYDPVGGPQWQAAFRAAKPEARLLPIGFASGEVPQVPANHLLVKNLSVIGVYWGGYLKFRPDVVTQSLQTLLGWYTEGRLKPHISHALPLDDIETGLDLLRTRKSTGKIVIEIAKEG